MHAFQAETEKKTEPGFERTVNVLQAVGDTIEQYLHTGQLIIKFISFQVRNPLK